MSDDIFELLYKNYDDMNTKMVREIELTTAHGGLLGSYREEMWMAFFRSMIPMKYALAQGVIIMDSKGNVSKEVDIAVYDEQYTPYVFRYHNLKIIPIEAVAVVIECKSTEYDSESLIAWSDAISRLEPVRTGIARMVQGYVVGLTNSTQVRSRPIRILASIRSAKKTETIDNWLDQLGNAFDFMICEHKGQSDKFVKRTSNSDKTLAWWGRELNGCDQEIAKEDRSNDPLDLQYLSKENVSKLRKKEKEREQTEKRRKMTDLEWLQEFTGLKFHDEERGFKLKNKLEDLNIPGNPFISLNLQLNQLLMLVNNPMLFPHFAYAAKFKEIGERFKEQTGKAGHYEEWSK